MSKNHITVRISDDELSRIQELSEALHLTKSEVVRRAVGGLNNTARMNDVMHELRDELLEKVQVSEARVIQKLAYYQHRSTKLLLKLLKAPEGAEQALEKLFEEGESSWQSQRAM